MKQSKNEKSNKLSPKDYDTLVSACNIYQELRRTYNQLTQIGGRMFAVARFAQSPSDVQRLRYAVSVFERLIGEDWYER